MLLAACQSTGPVSSDRPAAQGEIERWLAEQRVDGLCEKNEQIVFQCVAEHGRIAVCGGEFATRPYLQFRQQSGGTLIKYPDSLSASQPPFSIGSPWRTMGGEEHLTFEREGLQYDVYSIMVGVSASGRGEAEVQDGLAISNGERLISDVRCSAEVPLNAAKAEKLGAIRSN
jgi:hypothetical protein